MSLSDHVRPLIFKLEVYMTIQEYLRNIAHLSDYSSKVLKVFNQFDVSLRLDLTTSKPRICTYEINYFVNKADFQFEDVLTVNLFSYEFGIPIYSDPPIFEVAKLNPKGFGYVPDKDWEDWMKYNNINPDIIKKVHDILKSKPPVDY